jgi:hypothetical protein
MGETNEKSTGPVVLLSNARRWMIMSLSTLEHRPSRTCAVTNCSRYSNSGDLSAVSGSSAHSVTRKKRPSTIEFKRRSEASSISLET